VVLRVEYGLVGHAALEVVAHDLALPVSRPVTPRAVDLPAVVSVDVAQSAEQLRVDAPRAVDMPAEMRADHDLGMQRNIRRHLPDDPGHPGVEIGEHLGVEAHEVVRDGLRGDVRGRNRDGVEAGIVRSPAFIQPLDAAVLLPQPVAPLSGERVAVYAVDAQRLIGQAQAVKRRVILDARDHDAQELLEHRPGLRGMHAVAEEPAGAVLEFRPLRQCPVGEVVGAQEQVD